MAKTSPSKSNRDVWMELVQIFPLKPIHNHEELEQAQRMMDELSDRSSLLPDENDYLDVLCDIVEKYEKAHFPIPDSSENEILAALIEFKGVSKAEVARQTKIAVSTISEVSSGSRKLTAGHMASLARYFGVGPDVFFPMNTV